MSTTVCSLAKKHYEELSLFLERQTSGLIPKVVWMDRFPYFWEHNPVFREGRDERGWLMIDVHGRICGFFGNIPMLYCYRKEKTIFNAASSWYVEPAHRRYSLKLFRNFLKQDGVQFCTTPAPNVAAIFKKMDFESFEAEWLRKGYFFPTHSWELANFLRHRLFKNKSISTVFAMIMPLVSLFIDLYKFFYNQRNVKRKKKRYSIREIDQFGQEYDVFFQKFQSKFDVLAVRDRAILTWLFRGTPLLKSERKVLEIRKGQELIGYAALKEIKRQAPGRDVRYYEMVDVALLEENTGLLLELLDEIKSFAYKNRVAFVKIYSLCSGWKSVLCREGFREMTKEFRFIYKNLPDLPNLKTWFTPLDGDRGLF